MLSVIFDFLLVDLKDKHICINFFFKLRITARQIPQTKCEFVMIHKSNSNPLSGKKARQVQSNIKSISVIILLTVWALFHTKFSSRPYG
jgi:hypothetical protein